MGVVLSSLGALSPQALHFWALRGDLWPSDTMFVQSASILYPNPTYSIFSFFFESRHQSWKQKQHDHISSQACTSFGWAVFETANLAAHKKPNLGTLKPEPRNP